MKTLQLPSGRSVPVLGQGTWNMGEHPAHKRTEVAALQLGIDLGLTQKTAWYMLQRIRKYLGLDFPSADKERPAKKDLVKKRRSEKIEQIDVVVEKDKMQMLEWLQMLKKS